MSATHTPGPWRSHDVGDEDSPDLGWWVVDIPDDGERTVGRLYFGDMENNTGADLRNADLVAAAPDLLAACRLAMGALIDFGSDETDGALTAVAAAIHRATEGAIP